MHTQVAHWRAVRGYEGRYEISDHGQVRSLRAKHGPRVRLVKQVLASDGYLAVSLYDGERAHTRPVHVLVADAFISPRPNGLEVNHRDGDKRRNVADNLEYVTREGNIRHAVALGLHRVPCGEAHHKAKVSAEQVREIRSMVEGGKSQADAVRRFGLTRGIVSSICRRETWAHVQP